MKNGILLSILILQPVLLYAGTEVLSDQLPEGETLESLGLGERPFGPPERAVRLVEFASFAPDSYCQQVIGRGDHIYFAIKGGQILEYDLFGNPSAEPFLDVDEERFPSFRGGGGDSFSSGIRGFAFHPGYESNGLCYTIHRESGSGNADLGITSAADVEYVLAEWNMSGATPVFREVVRIGFLSGKAHRAQNIGFNPHALRGEPDYGLLYCCIGDNSDLGGVFDSSENGQDFSNIFASVIRIDPLDPSGRTDQELADAGLKRSANGSYAIPRPNPFVGQAGSAEELFATGLRNPMTLAFTPAGEPIVGDTGENAIEEINLLKNGGNYGWGIREGTFAFTWADQETGAVLDPDASLTWIPFDEAQFIWLRDSDGGNPRQVSVAREGSFSDGFVYPVAQYSHEGNNNNGSSAIAGGGFYSGFQSEELEGVYVFGDFASDALYYVEADAIQNDNVPAEVWRLPLVDEDDNSITLESLIGDKRANMRFGKDAYGNLYLSSKTNFRVYRFEGTSELTLSISSTEESGEDYPLIGLTYALSGEGGYELLSSTNLNAQFSSGGFVSEGAVTNASGALTEQFRYTTPFNAEDLRYFKGRVQAAP